MTVEGKICKRLPYLHHILGMLSIDVHELLTVIGIHPHIYDDQSLEFID